MSHDPPKRNRPHSPDVIAQEACGSDGLLSQDDDGCCGRGCCPQGRIKMRLNRGASRQVAEVLQWLKPDDAER